MNYLSPEHRYWKQLGYSNPNDSAEYVLHVSSLSDMNIDPLFTLMHNRGIQRVHQEDAPLWLIVVDTFGDLRLSTVNEKALEQEIQLFVMKPAGIEVEYALFNNTSACWTCFYQRNRLLDGPATYLSNTSAQSNPVVEPAVYTETTTALAFNWVMLELERLLINPDNNPLSGTLRSVQLDKMITTDHIITQLPYCPACGIQKGKLENFPKPPVINLTQRMANPA